MLVVTSLQGQTEPLPDAKGVEVAEQVNGEYSIKFVCSNTENNRYAYPLVQEESIVELDGHEFRIKQMNEVRTSKEVHAQHIFFDLVDHYQEGTFGGTHTVDEFFSYALNGTGWTFENVDVTGGAFIPNFGEGNVVALIRQICDAFGCEIKIEPNRHIKIYKQIGTDKDEQFRYKHNIKTIKKSVDTTKLATVIKGYGANGLVVEYHSPNEAIYGTRYAEPIKDDQYTTAESLTERLKQELVDVPEVSIELELSQLGFDVELGDRVWVIYEPLGIDFQTRVMEIKRYPFTKRSPVVTLSNKKRVFTDILTETKVDIEENKKETRSRIEQTNERITMEVERIDESIATLQIEADNIQLSVQSLDNRMGQAEATLTLHANEIEQRVTYTDFNGNEIASRINQTATTVTIEASKINLNGITLVNSTLRIGETMDWGSKELIFRDNAAINSPQNTESLEIWSIGYVYLNADEVRFDSPYGYTGTIVNLSTAGGIIWGANAPYSVQYASSAGNADTLDGYHASAFSFSGHSHAGTYVQDRFGQYLSIYVDDATGDLVVYKNGVNMGRAQLI
ncbi:phage tail protein [Saccharococcus caldoxylosilyticus]|uniref:phage tail protein n=1 Tax=Saccharococcus caldoxylosilyticus TaxID=81408 RepID=UPI003D325082